MSIIRNNANKIYLKGSKRNICPWTQLKQKMTMIDILYPFDIHTCKCQQSLKQIYKHKQLFNKHMTQENKMRMSMYIQ